MDLFEIGLLPPLRGIYRRDLELSTENVWNRIQYHPHFKEVQIDGILLSHAHLDHSGYISFLDQSIPIITSTLTAFIAKAIQDSSRTDFEKEVCYLIPKEEKQSRIEAKDWRKNPSIQRPYKLADECKLSSEAYKFWSTPPGARQIASKPLEKISQIGGLTLKLFPVDHSIFGAGAFAVETSRGWVIYTGDLRMHGKKSSLTMEFAQEVSKLEPAVLLCEGTNVDLVETFDEETVHQKALDIIKDCGGLVIVDFGPRNVERLLTFREIAKDCNRRLVILARDVYLLEKIRLVMDEIPDPKTDEIMVLYDEIKQLDKWEETLYERYSHKRVKAEVIRDHQEEYILCFSFWDINELIEIRPKRGGVYLYSSSEPFNEEQLFDIGRLRNWLDRFGLIPVGLPDPETGRVSEHERGLHASGHIIGPHLLELIEIINPEIIVPIHTENPEFFMKYLGEQRKVIIPEPGEIIEI